MNEVDIYGDSKNLFKYRLTHLNNKTGKFYLNHLNKSNFDINLLYTNVIYVYMEKRQVFTNKIHFEANN